MEKKKIGDGLDHYLCGTILGKGTLYGPAEFLSERQNRFRIMNRQEFIHYMIKVNETDGFDVDGCTGCLPGAVTPASGLFLQDAEDAAKFAVLQQEKEDGGIPLKFGRLVKANTQPTSILLFYLTLTAVDTTDQEEKTYRAKVWLKPGMELSLRLFEEVPKDDKIVRRKKFVADVKAEKRVQREKRVKERRGVQGDRISPRRVTARSIGSESCSKSAGVSLTAWRMLLNEMRSQNPSLSFFKAKKAASKKWRSFMPTEREPYMKEAKEMYAKKLH